jgi:predicted alpha/beta-hydrolase family hydrolase
LEIEKHARERWWHEDDLVNQRTTWLLTTQGILAAGYAFLRYRIAELLEGRPLAQIDPFRRNYVGELETLANAIALVGLVSCAVTFLGIFAAVIAQRALAAQYPFVLGVTPGTTATGQLVGLATPVLCATAWFVALGVFRGLIA